MSEYWFAREDGLVGVRCVAHARCLSDCGSAIGQSDNRVFVFFILLTLTCLEFAANVVVRY